MQIPGNTIGPEGGEKLQTTPYTRDDDELRVLLEATLQDPSALYLDRTTNPEIGKFSIYSLDGADARADIGRTLEAKIFNRDAGYEAGFIQENFEDYDNNSVFLIFVDTEAEGMPRAVGALRIIDCLRGGSETISMFDEFHGDTKPLPSELTVSDLDRANGLWDILTIVMEPEYRDGVNSAWLYHGLYAKALQENVARMIANMTPNETRNLRQYVGVPFKDIEGADPVQETTPNGKTSIYGFYTMDVAEIHSSISKNIGQLETAICEGVDADTEGLYSMLVHVAKIVINGRSS